MQKFLSVIALGAALSFNAMAQPAATAVAPAKAAPATAAAPMATPPATANKAPTAQQSKMATCNSDAKTKTLQGAERQAFMKTCLSAGGGTTTAAAPAGTAQQQKMKTCNADAKTKVLKGTERQAFMKTCLSDKPAA